MKTLDYTLEIKAFDEEAGTFEGHASVFDVEDLGGDRVRPGAFKRSLHRMKQQGKKVPILWQHNPHEPVGVSEAWEDDYGLAVKGELILDVQRAREARSLMKKGVLGGLSIGYDVVRDQWNDDGTRDLIELKLYEYSIVTWPMNEAATYGGVKTYAPSDLRHVALEMVRLSAACRASGQALSETDQKFAQEALASLKALFQDEAPESDPPSNGPSDDDVKTGGPANESDLGDPEFLHSLQGIMADMKSMIGTE